MITVTVQIGNSDNKLTQDEWAMYVKEVQRAINYYCPDVHFFGGSPNWERWQNVAGVVNSGDHGLTQLAKRLVEIKEKYRQDSIAWTQGNTAFI